MQETGTRINKYMSQCGYCSRREADRLIEKGKYGLTVLWQQWEQK